MNRLNSFCAFRIDRHYRVTVTIIWLFAMVINLPWLFVFRLEPLEVGSSRQVSLVVICRCHLIETLAYPMDVSSERNLPMHDYFHSNKYLIGAIKSNFSITFLIISFFRFCFVSTFGLTDTRLLLLLLLPI